MPSRIPTERYLDVCTYALDQILPISVLPKWIGLDRTAAAEQMVKVFDREWLDFERDLVDECPDITYDFIHEISSLFPMFCLHESAAGFEIDISKFYN